MPNADSFKRGTVEIAVLAVLREEDLYGYQIVQRIAEKSDGFFTLPLGTLYPALANACASIIILKQAEKTTMPRCWRNTAKPHGAWS